MFWLNIFTFLVILHAVSYREGYTRENYEYELQLKLFCFFLSYLLWDPENLQILLSLQSSTHFTSSWPTSIFMSPNQILRTTQLTKKKKKIYIYIYMKLKVGWKSQFHQKYYALSFFWLNLILSWHFSSPLKFTFKNLLKLVHVTT